ncbi:hypothetical protein BVRB_1g013560 [Beta vulgaris subsp. vulgaris]|nr:hypothetical protein BVRB_1g013560 [Beta vulgaris subsp. vulgaris]
MNSSSTTVVHRRTEADPRTSMNRAATRTKKRERKQRVVARRATRLRRAAKGVRKTPAKPGRNRRRHAGEGNLLNSKALNNLKVCVVDGNMTRGRANVIDDDDEDEESIVPNCREHSDDNVGFPSPVRPCSTLLSQHPRRWCCCCVVVLLLFRWLLLMVVLRLPSPSPLVPCSLSSVLVSLLLLPLLSVVAAAVVAMLAVVGRCCQHLAVGGLGKVHKGGILPLEVGTRVMCRWRDCKYHPVKVIERRKTSYGGPNDYEYYVHYTEFNRRLDEWVKLDQLDLSSVETVVDEKVEDKVWHAGYLHIKGKLIAPTNFRISL